MEELTAGARLGDRYSLLERVGAGGTADVWKARDERLGRDVAVKIVRPSVQIEAARFGAEVAAHAALDHPSIVRVLDASPDAEEPFLVLTYVDGHPLHEEIARGPMHPDRVRDLALQLATALDHAHSRGIVHRDVKPGNVLLARDGTALLTDFGIARLDGSTRVTRHGTVWGSAAYIAPEQLRDDGVGPATDVYSLGLVLLEALTGERPFRGTTVEVAMARLTRTPPVPDSLPDPWPPLLRGMLATDPADRPRPAEVAHLLDPSPAVATHDDARGAATTVAIDVVDVTAEHTTVLPLHPSVGAAGRHRPLAWMSLGIAAVALVLTALALGGGDEAPQPDPAPTASTVDVAGTPDVTAGTSESADERPEGGGGEGGDEGRRDEDRGNDGRGNDGRGNEGRGNDGRGN